MLSFRVGTLRNRGREEEGKVVQRLVNVNGNLWEDTFGNYHGRQWEKSVYYFDGTGYIDTQQVATALTGTVTLDLQATSSGCIMSNRHSGNNYFELDAGGVGQPLITVTLKESPHTYTLDSNFINDGNWHEAKVLYDGSQIVITIDGTQDAVLSNLTPISTNNNNIVIGNNGSGGHNYNGYMSNFIWRDLTGLPILKYNMEEREGDIALDSSGLETHGLFVGGVEHQIVRIPGLINQTNEYGYDQITYFDGKSSYIIHTAPFNFENFWEIEISLQKHQPTFQVTTDRGAVVASGSSPDFIPLILKSNGAIVVRINNIEFESTNRIHYDDLAVVKVNYSGGTAGTINIYINGTLDSSHDYTGSVFAHNRPLYIGTNSSQIEYYRGYMRDITIKNDGIVYYKSDLLDSVLGEHLGVPTDINVHFMVTPRVDGMTQVQPYAWTWLTQQLYLMYGDNYFRPGVTNDILVGDPADYNAITDITINYAALITDFNNQFFEFFNFLTTLNLAHNHISIIELDFITNLTSLIANDNHLLFLDTNVLTVLNYLDVGQNNLPSIDINHLTDLTYVDVSSNNISVLIIDNLVNLTDLIADNNNLVDIDITNNQLLSTILVNDNLFDAATNDNLLATVLTNVIANNITGGTINSTIFGPGYLSPQAIDDYLELQNTYGWNMGSGFVIVIGGVAATTYNVEDFPLLWINVPYYTNYTANTFIVPAGTTHNMPGQSDYDLITVIDLNSSLLTTDFTDTFISKYRNLQNLILNNNTITVVDVISAVSLINLNISENQIQTLDLTGNVLLENLTAYNNFISTLNVTNNISLESINVESNILQTIDVSNNILLNYINFKDNLFNSFNASQVIIDIGNNNISNGTIEGEITVGGGYITPTAVGNALDLTGNRGWTIVGLPYELYPPTHPDYNGPYNVQDFPYIWIDGGYFNTYTNNTFDVPGLIKMTTQDEYNFITNINLSSKGLTTDFNQTFFQWYFYLQDVNISNNNVTVFEPSNTISLISINCENNQITSLSTNNLINLEFLYANNNALTDLDLSGATQLNYVTAQNNNIQTLILNNNGTIQTLNVTSNQITTINATNFSLLDVIRISNNQLDRVEISNLLVNINDTNTLPPSTPTVPATNKIIDASIFGPGQLLPPAVLAYIDLESKGWTIIGLTIQFVDTNTYDVEDFPITWINDLYYQTFTGDTFVFSATQSPTTDFPIATDYANITSIDLTTSNLTTNFTATLLNHYFDLTELILKDNAISIVDLTNASGQLITIDISNNQIQTIDLSNEPNAVEFIAYRNLLTSVDISNNPFLEVFNAYDNLLTFVDFSTASAIREIDIQGNQTDNVNISLIVIDVDNLGTGAPNSNYKLHATVINTTPITPAAVGAVISLNNKGWDVQGIPYQLLAATTYNVQDFPFTWITNNYYVTYTGNTFVNPANINMPTQSDYDTSYVISLPSQSLTTLFNFTLLSKYNNLTDLILYDNAGLEVTDITANLQLVNVDVKDTLSSFSDVTNNVLLETLIVNSTSVAITDISNNTLLKDVQLNDTLSIITDISNNPDLEILSLNNTDSNIPTVINNPNLTTIGLQGTNTLTVNLDQILSDLHTLHFVNGNTTFGTFLFNINLSLPANNNYVFLHPMSLQYMDDLSNNTLNYIWGFFYPTLIPSGTTVSIQNNPYTWYTNFASTYSTYTANTYQLAVDTSMPTMTDYGSVTILNLAASGLTTDFTEELLSKFNNLISIILNDNSISVIDITGNGLLTTINISNNNISVLDISNNPLLTSIAVLNNNLTDLDISNNPLLNDIFTLNNQLDAITHSQMLLDLNSFGVVGGTWTTSVVGNDAISPTAVDAYNNLTDANVLAWTIIGIDTFLIANTNYTVQSAPLIWIQTNAYQTYTGNLFQVPVNTPLLGQSDYDLTTSIVVNNSSLTTDFTLDMMSLFPNLDELNVSYNDITTLDVSNNTLLRILDAQYNTTLNAINIDNNYLLEELYLNVTGISTINLLFNPLLTDLELQGNNLTSIDISNNINLARVRVNNNLISQLDTSNQLALQVLTVHESPNLTSLDLQFNTELKALYAYDTGLQTIDISNNPDLIDVRLKGNAFDGETVSKVLLNLYAFGLLNGYVSISGETPSDILTPTGVTMYNNLLINGWIIADVKDELVPGVDYKIEDAPGNWIEDALYTSWNEDTFQVAATTSMFDLDDYDSVTTIDISNNNLLTDLNSTFMNKFPNLNALNIENNSISVLTVTNNTNLQYLFAFNNQLKAITNSQILIDLDNNGIQNGIFESMNFDNSTLTYQAQLAKDNLVNVKGWTVTLPDYYLLNNYPNAEAAYSLYLLDGTYTGACVEVRRDSDNSVQNIGFVNGILDTAALTTFCTQDVDVYTSDFSAGGDVLTQSNVVATNGESVAGVNDAYKVETISTGSAVLHQVIKGGQNENANFTVSFDYYIPSTNTVVNQLQVGFVGGTGTTYVGGLNSWNSVTLNLSTVSSGNLFFRPSVGANIVFDAAGELIYIKNVVITQTSDANGLVTKWYDQSGNGYDATQSTASSQPKIFDSVNGIVLENGKPALSFDGVDDGLSVDIVPDKNQPFTAFFVRRYLNITGTFVGLSVDSTPNTGYLEIANSVQFRSYYGSYLTGITSNTDQGLWYSLANSTSSQIGLDNQTAITGNAGTSGLEAINIGSAQTAFFANMNVQEFIIYNSDQSSNRAAIEDNINSRYNIY